jgi:hypothetical protein
MNHKRTETIISPKAVFILTVSAFILMPKPGGAGTQFFLILYFSFAIFFFALTSSKYKISNTHRRHISFLFIITIVSTVSFIASFIFSHYDITFSDSAAFFRPLIFFFIFCVGLITSSQMNGSQYDASSAFRTISIIFIISQTPFILMNILGVNSLSAIYDFSKSKPLGSGLRVVGTMTNPNFFGVITSFLFFSIISFYKKNKIDWILLILLFTFILLSGSKSALLISVGVTAMLLISSSSTSRIKKISYILILGAFVLSGILFLYNNKDDFRYLSSIFILFEGGSIDDIKSISDRHDIWYTAQYLFNHTPGLAKFIFGLGPIAELNSLDNDFLYSFFRWGILGSILFYGLWVSFFYIATRHGKFDMLMFGVFVSLIALGLQAETFSSLIYGVFILYMLPTMAKVGQHG